MNDNEKKAFEKPCVEIVLFGKNDIVTMSNVDQDPEQGEWDEL